MEELMVTIPLEYYNELRDDSRNFFFLRDTLIECAYIAQLKPDELTFDDNSIRVALKALCGWVYKNKLTILKEKES